MQRGIDDYIGRKQRLDREKNFPPKKLSHEEIFNPDKKALLEKENALLREAMQNALLWEALETDDPASVEILLKNGVLPDYQAFNNAANNGKWKAVLAFVRNNPDAAEQKEYADIEGDVVLVAEKNSQADIYGNVLLLAEKNSQTEVVNSLLDKKAPLYYCYTNCHEYEGWCVLHYAAARGEIALVKRLLSECKVDPDWKGKNAPTPLELAYSNNHPELAELLLSYGEKAGSTEGIDNAKQQNYFFKTDTDCSDAKLIEMDSSSEESIVEQKILMTLMKKGGSHIKAGSRKEDLETEYVERKDESYQLAHQKKLQELKARAYWIIQQIAEEQMIFQMNQQEQCTEIHSTTNTHK